MPDDAKPRETSAQLRGDIDSGLTGDKVAGADPAAAPLGTDAEAAGTPPSPVEIAQARRQERSATPSATRNAAQPQLSPDGRIGASTPVLTGAAVGVAAALLLGVFLWLSLR